MLLALSKLQLVPALVAILLGGHGLRKRSLSPSGALAALVVGYLMLAVTLRSFGINLIVFYLVGSRATKFGKARKSKLEEGYQEAGYRNAYQVFCNSLSAFIASVFWSAKYDPNSIPAQLFASHMGLSTLPYASDTWCPISSPVDNSWSRFLVFMMLGHFSCCLGDTLASELGILSTTPPVLITTWKRVPPGTNGGMSVMGTTASVAGGMIMGLSLFCSLMVENTVCRAYWPSILTSFVFWGSLGGGLGSMVDSFLGATVQESKYSVDNKMVLSDDSDKRNAADVKSISGLNILTNNQVNLLSSIITSVVIASSA